LSVENAPRGVEQGIPGPESDGLAHVGDGLSGFSHEVVSPASVVIRRGVVRANAQGRIEFGDGLVILFRSGVGNREMEMACGLAWINRGTGVGGILYGGDLVVLPWRGDCLLVSRAVLPQELEAGEPNAGQHQERDGCCD